MCDSCSSQDARPKQMENSSTSTPLITATENYMAFVAWGLTTVINWFCDKCLDRDTFFNNKAKT